MLSLSTPYSRVGGSRGVAPFILNLGPVEASGQLHVLAALVPRKESRYRLKMRRNSGGLRSHARDIDWLVLFYLWHSATAAHSTRCCTFPFMTRFFLVCLRVHKHRLFSLSLCPHRFVAVLCAASYCFHVRPDSFYRAEILVIKRMSKHHMTFSSHSFISYEYFVRGFVHKLVLLSSCRQMECFPHAASYSSFSALNSVLGHCDGRHYQYQEQNVASNFENVKCKTIS
jgi:hypothetical protein